MSRNSALPLIAIAGLLCGCADYLNRYDTVTLAAGDAQKHNMLLQTADPFNPAAQDNHIPTSGARTAFVMRRLLLPPTVPAPSEGAGDAGPGPGDGGS
ncbi:hypothetical protein [Mesorhizobium sp. ANAO-SY3R2]|uniref:hypothetical protein n=1 Tax=Mesorhizobium sp. ANAO-SY3R2 TaxID=3166644 RepID=UPI00366B33F2